MALQERSPFDVGKLRAGLARLNRSGLFEPLTLGDLEIRRRPDTLTADLTVSIRERPGRRWSLSGPLGPSAIGLLEAEPRFDVTATRVLRLSPESSDAIASVYRALEAQLRPHLDFPL